MRKLSALIGTVLAIGIAALTFLTSGVDIKYFINGLGLAIVIGGTLAAIFLSYSFSDVIRLVSIVSRIFLRDDKSLKKIGTELMQFAEKCAANGIPSEAKGIVHPFLNDCIAMIEDGYDEDRMRDILEQRIYSMYDHERYETNLIRQMSKYPPAFGMVGTVVGLIALMATLGGDKVDMSMIGNYMAVALTTTLYGLMLANFMFKPISDNLEIGSRDNMKVRQIILEVSLLIRKKTSLLVIQDHINSMIPPREAVSYIGFGSGGKSAA